MKRDKSADDLFRALKLLDQKLQKKVIKKGLKAGAKIIVAEIEAQAPAKTHLIQRSVKILAGKRRKKFVSLSVVVVTDGDKKYVGHVEWGTRKTQANPFIRRSVEAKKAEAAEKVHEVIEQDLKASGWIR